MQIFNDIRDFFTVKIDRRKHNRVRRYKNTTTNKIYVSTTLLQISDDVYVWEHLIEIEIKDTKTYFIEGTDKFTKVKYKNGSKYDHMIQLTHDDFIKIAEGK